MPITSNPSTIEGQFERVQVEEEVIEERGPITRMFDTMIEHPFATIAVVGAVSYVGYRAYRAYRDYADNTSGLIDHSGVSLPAPDAVSTAMSGLVGLS